MKCVIFGKGDYNGMLWNSKIKNPDCVKLKCLCTLHPSKNTSSIRNLTVQLQRIWNNTLIHSRAITGPLQTLMLCTTKGDSKKRIKYTCITYCTWITEALQKNQVSLTLNIYELKGKGYKANIYLCVFPSGVKKLQGWVSLNIFCMCSVFMKIQWDRSWVLFLYKIYVAYHDNYDYKKQFLNM